MTAKIFQQPSIFEVRYVNEVGGCERPHTHSSLIVSAVSGGSISLQIHDNETRLEKGKVAVVGPNMLHCVRSYSPNFEGVYVLDIFALPTSCSEFNMGHFQMFNSQQFHGDQAYNDFMTLCFKLLSPLAACRS